MPRITETAKQQTRQRVLRQACQLFRERGFESTTTREIAAAAGIAAGTLFNYFPTKELIVLSLIEQGLLKARKEFDKLRRCQASLEEDLFLHIATGLRKLKRHRKYLRPALETVLGPLVASGAGDAGHGVRHRHLETVHGIVAAHRSEPAISSVTLQIYWTLYTGVLAFWAEDPSPKQEDTLAILDQSVSMFVSSLADADDLANEAT